MIVVFAEKPDAARNFARVLKATQKKDGYLEGNGYQVTWGFGHLVGIAEPGEMKESWEQPWAMEQLPMIPNSFKLKVLPGKDRQFKVVKNLIKGADVVINATDAGREGELIFRNVYKLCGVQKPIKRLWISDLNDESIEEGFRNLKDGKDLEALGDAAQCRSESDWLVGMNATRGYTLKNGQLCTVGRVQTPTLALIVNRHHEIKKFTKSYYYEVFGNTKGTWFQWFNKEGPKIQQEDVATQLANRLNRKRGAITGVETKEKRLQPPALFYLAELQRACNKAFGWTAKETLEKAQELYEKEKIITYPRTSSQHLSEAMVPQFRAMLDALPQELLGWVEQAKIRAEKGHKIGKRFVDDTKLSDHHAIVPTKTSMNPELRSDLKQLYMMIAKRFLSIFFPDRILNSTVVHALVDGETLEAKGIEEIQKGWRILYEQDKEEDPFEPLGAIFEEGDSIELELVEKRQQETKPPSKFTEGTLITAMEKAGKHIEDAELAEKMKGCGLGQESTRAEIIERLVKSNYIERHKKQLEASQKGIELIQQVTPTLKSPDLTAGWEMMLEEMAEGCVEPVNFMRGITEFIKNVIPEIQKIVAMPQPPKEMIGKCPLCGAGVYENRIGYSCEKHRETGCKFLIWKEMSGKKITPTLAKTILALKPTPLLKGFKSKANKPFEAHIKWCNEKNCMVLEFPKTQIKKPIGVCPECQGEVRENNFGFGCSNWKEGCKFQISKTICGKTISEKRAQSILQTHRTELISDFKSKAGKPFSAYLKLDGGKVVLEFPQRELV